MRLERISANEIKAYLSPDDLDELGIKDASRLDRGTAELILGIAKAELDFKYEKNNCEIYSEPCGKGYALTIKASAVRGRAEPPHECVLCFDSEKTLYNACVFLRRFALDSSELREEGEGRDKTYYLILKYGEIGPLIDGKPYWLISVSELCRAVFADKNAFFYYISEHSACIIEKNAVFDIANREKKW